MSWRTVKKVWDHSKLRGGDLLVLLAIAEYADDLGRAHPGMHTIAARGRMSHRNARICVRHGIESGELVVLRKGGVSGERRESTRYRVMLADLPDNLPSGPNGGNIVTGDKITSVKPITPLPGKPTSPKPPMEPPVGIPPTPTNGQAGGAGAEEMKRQRSRSKTPESDAAMRIAALFHRRPTTQWSEKEIRSFRLLVPIDLGDLELVCCYTEAERMRGDDGIHRRSMEPLLNNFQGEVDRAREWERRNRKLAAKMIAARAALREGGAASASQPATEPEGFRAWLAKEFPRADAAMPWEKIPREIRAQFKPEAAPE